MEEGGELDELPEGWDRTLQHLEDLDASKTLSIRAPAQEQGSEDENPSISFPNPWEGLPALEEKVELSSTLFEREEEPMEPEEETTLSENITRSFRLHDTIGKGGMGSIFRAEQRSLQRMVALKVFNEPYVKVSDVFRQEALMGARLSHPNLVPVHDVGHDYLAMRLVKGRPLSKTLHDDPPSPFEMAEILIRVSEALEVAHREGVLHRDIKPSNIMTGSFGEVFLVDWGLALQGQRKGKRWKYEVDDDLVCAGTPAYLAPEMAQGEVEKFGPKTDVFLLGATLYHLLSGRPPFVASTARAAIALALKSSPPSLKGTAGLPRRLVEIQEGAMEPNPKKRLELHRFIAELREWQQCIANEKRAEEALARDFELEKQPLHHLSSTEVYAHLRERYQGLKTASELDPDSQQARQRLNLVLADHVNHAIDHGDLMLAGTLMPEFQPPVAGNTVAQRLNKEKQIRRRERLRSLVAKTLLVLMVFSTLIVGWALLSSILESEERRRSEREREAAALLQRSATVRQHQSPGWLETSLQLISRAMGLDPRSEAAIDAMVSIHSEQIQEALKRDSLLEAESWYEDIGSFLSTRPGWEAELQQLRSTIDEGWERMNQKRTQELQRREKRMGQLQSRIGHGEMPTSWKPGVVAEISAWDGKEWEGQLQDWLQHEDPIQMRLSLEILANRSDLGDDRSIAELLNHEDGIVRESAWQALVKRDPPVARGAMIEHLHTIPSTLERRIMGSSLWHWPPDDPALKGSAPALFLTTHFDRGLALPWDDGDLDHLLSRAKALTLGQSHPKAAAPLLAILREQKPQDPWSWHLSIEAARQQGLEEQMRTLISEGEKAMGDRAWLMKPWRVLLSDLPPKGQALEPLPMTLEDQGREWGPFAALAGLAMARQDPENHKGLRILTRWSRSHRHHFQRASDLSSGGRRAESRRIFRILLEELPHHPKARRGLARDLMEQGDGAGALHQVDELLAWLPRHGAFLELKAELLTASEGKQAGWEAWNHPDLPNHPEVFSQRILLARQLRRPSSLLENIEAWLKWGQAPGSLHILKIRTQLETQGWTQAAQTWLEMNRKGVLPSLRLRAYEELSLALPQLMDQPWSWAPHGHRADRHFIELLLLLFNKEQNAMWELHRNAISNLKQDDRLAALLAWAEVARNDPEWHQKLLEFPNHEQRSVLGQNAGRRLGPWMRKAKALSHGHEALTTGRSIDILNAMDAAPLVKAGHLPQALLDQVREGLTQLLKEHAPGSSEFSDE